MKMSLSKLRLIELITIMISIFLGFFNNVSVENGINLGGIFNFTFYFITLLNVLFVMYEFKYKRPYFRLIYLLLVIELVRFLNVDLIHANAYLWFFHLMYAFLLIISNIFVKKSRDEIVIEKGKYPTGIFTKKQKNLYNIIFISYVLLLSCYVVYNLFKIQDLVQLILVVLLLSIYFIIFVSLINPFIKMNKLIFKDVKLNEFLDGINKLKTENINSDSYKYLLIMESNYMVLKDINKSMEIFESIEKPNNKGYLKIYEMIELCYYINKKDKDTYDIKVKEYQKKYPKDKLVNRLDLLFKIDDKNEKIDDIEIKFNVNVKNYFTRISNANQLMTYFFIREDLINAKKYAQIIVDMKANDFIETYNKALNILEQK